MRSFVVTPPAPVVTWEEADDHLKLDGDTSQQAEVEARIAAATGHIDGPDGWLGRALGLQTLEARFDRFHGHHHHHALTLPCPPLIEVVSLKYLDWAGAEQILAPETYEVRGREVGPTYLNYWPSVACHPEAVRVRYRAGYDPLVTPLPAAIRAAILLMVGDLHRFRETASPMNLSPTEIPMSTTVVNLLGPYRLWS